jgi:hypothetical protein
VQLRAYRDLLYGIDPLKSYELLNVLKIKEFRLWMKCGQNFV